jgi:hypothetical protein
MEPINAIANHTLFMNLLEEIYTINTNKGFDIVKYSSCGLMRKQI